MFPEIGVCAGGYGVHPCPIDTLHLPTLFLLQFVSGLNEGGNLGACNIPCCHAFVFKETGTHKVAVPYNL
jgi:hypothetical protein